MTTDPFTTAARAEADDRFLIDPDHPGQTTKEWIAIFEQGAEWARTYLAEQEVTDVEVEDPTPLQESIARALILPPYVRGQLSKIGPVMKRREAERIALAAAVLPLIAAEVRKAQADAWDEGYGKGSSPYPFVQRNPYRATDIEKED